MLRKISDILRPKKTSNPYNLKDSELHQLMELREHPHWESFQALLDKMCTFLGEDMLAAGDLNVVAHYRSYILGLRRAGTIVDELINQEKAKDARERTRDSRRESDRDKARNLATFGSPFWK